MNEIVSKTTTLFTTKISGDLTNTRWFENIHDANLLLAHTINQIYDEEKKNLELLNKTANQK
jgi:hypothetical protein